MRNVWVVSALLPITGCAGYTITLNGDGEGYDVYRPEPYLMAAPAKPPALANPPVGTKPSEGQSTPEKDAQGKLVLPPTPPSPPAPTKPAPTGVEFSLVWLPNYSKRYRIHTWNFLAKADFKFTITDGWKLTGVEDNGDNTTLANTFAGKLMDLATKIYALDGGAEKVEVPILYKIVFDEGSGFPVGLYPVKVVAYDNSKGLDVNLESLKKDMTTVRDKMSK